VQQVNSAFVQLVCKSIIPARSIELDGAKPVLRTYELLFLLPSFLLILLFVKPTYGLLLFLFVFRADLGLNILMLKRLIACFRPSTTETVFSAFLVNIRTSLFS